MRFSDLTSRICGTSVDAWDVHYRAMARLKQGDDIFLLSVGQESYELTDPRIVQAAQDSLAAGRHHYTPVEGELTLRKALVERHRQRSGQQVNEDNCVVFLGAQNGLFASAQCLLQAGDEVIIPEPYYTTYPATFTLTGADIVSVPCKEGDDFQVNVEGVLDAITEKTQAIVLNSPNNPTGAVYPRERLEKIVRACVENDIWLICDDVYSELIEPEQFYPAASIDGADQVVITVSSLSKSHRMTGWRMGWAIAPLALAKNFYNLNMCMSYGMAGFIQDAALAALKFSDDIVPSIRANINTRREVLSEELAKISAVDVVPSHAGMFVMIDIRRLNMSGQSFCSGLLDQYDVGAIPCDGFGPAGAGLIRLSACDEPVRLREACRRIGKYVDSLV